MSIDAFQPAPELIPSHPENDGSLSQEDERTFTEITTAFDVLSRMVPDPDNIGAVAYSSGIYTHGSKDTDD